MSRMTVIDVPPELAAASVAVTLMTFSPSSSSGTGPLADPVPVGIVTARPAGTETSVVSVASTTEAVRPTDPAPTTLPSAGASIVTTGACCRR